MIDRKPRPRRSPKWAALAKRFLRANSCCAVCGRSENVVAHHICPFHLFPSMELDEANLIPLCEGRTVNCHLAVGHLFLWASYNPAVVLDAAAITQKVKMRPGVAKI